MRNKAHIITGNGLDGYILKELVELKNELYSTGEIDGNRFQQLRSVLTENIISREAKKLGQGIINDIENYISQ